MGDQAVTRSPALQQDLRHEDQPSPPVSALLPPTENDAETQKPFNFLALPPELRLDIYDHLFQSHNGYELPSLSILGTSKQIHAEANQILRHQDIVLNLIGMERMGIVAPNWDSHTVRDWRKMLLRFRSVTLRVQVVKPFFRPDALYTQPRFLLMSPDLRQVRKFAAILSALFWPSDFPLSLELERWGIRTRWARLNGYDNVIKALWSLINNESIYHRPDGPVELIREWHVEPVEWPKKSDSPTNR